jgi:hypothetical protein
MTSRHVRRKPDQGYRAVDDSAMPGESLTYEAEPFLASLLVSLAAL